jgi:hypothetical protein
MKSLSEHAAYELTKAGLANNEDPEARQTAVNIMALVRRLEKQKNSDGQIEFILESLNRLLNGLPLTAITDDPEEWEQYELQRYILDPVTKQPVGEPERQAVWQSKRASHIVSYTMGQTWIDQATGKSGQSLDHIEEAKKKEKEAARKVVRTKPIGHVAPDAPASEVAADDPRNGNESGDSVDKAADNVNKESEQ